MPQNNDDLLEQNEDEIFKTLSHKIRRDIIKLLGQYKSLTFTEIKQELEDIDSPSLSYHLKSLKVVIKQDQNLYFLTDVGISALNLMDRIDQSAWYKKGKRAFFIANWVTIACWCIVLFLVPSTIGSNIEAKVSIFLSITLNVIAQINFQVNWRLFGKNFHTPKKAPRRKRRKRKDRI